LATVAVVGVLAAWASGSLALAALAAGALAFNPLMALVGRACLTDSLLMLFTTASLALFFLASEKRPPRDRLWYLLAWAALGLGFLTKGPVAPAVVLPAAAIYALWQRRLWEVLKRAQVHWGLLIFVLINLPWYGLAFQRLGWEFWEAFFVSQNLRRFSEVLLGHGGGLAYYLPVVVMGAFPMAAAAAPAVGRALAANARAARQADPLARLRLFCAIAALWVLVVFSAAATKQINYIQPALPFLALLAGYFLWRRAAGEAAGRWTRGAFWALLVGPGLLWALILAAVPLGVSHFWPEIQGSIRYDSSEYALPASPPLLVFWPLLAALAAAAAVLAPQALWRRGRRAGASLAVLGGGLALSAVLVLGLLPQAAEVIQTPAVRLARQANQRAPQAEVVSFGLWKPSLFYYLDRRMPRVRSDEPGRLAELLARPEPVLVMSRTRLAERLRGLPGFSELARAQGYLLGGNPAAAEVWGRSQQDRAVGSPEGEEAGPAAEP
jgi:4-amino-4-deoxy-L-arabinose transferase-like glycosyltransferase